MYKGQVMELFRDYEGFCRKYNLITTYKGFQDWCNAELKDYEQQETEGEQ